MEIPQWAVSTFAVVFFLVLGLAGWAFRYLAVQMESKLDKIDAKMGKVREDVGQIKERIVRLETRANGQSFSMTPPRGSPTYSP
jgi:hypothetical protein